MALDGDTSKSKENSAIATAWVHPLAERLKSARREGHSEFRSKGTLKGITHKGGHLFSRTFRNFERNVASDAISTMTSTKP